MGLCISYKLTFKKDKSAFKISLFITYYKLILAYIELYPIVSFLFFYKIL